MRLNATQRRTIVYIAKYLINYFIEKCPPRDSKECEKPKASTSPLCFDSPNEKDKKIDRGDDIEMGQITISKPGGIPLFTKREEGTFFVSQ